jgi:hypothetical protein
MSLPSVHPPFFICIGDRDVIIERAQNGIEKKEERERFFIFFTYICQLQTNGLNIGIFSETKTKMLSKKT